MGSVRGYFLLQMAPLWLLRVLIIPSRYYFFLGKNIYYIPYPLLLISMYLFGFFCSPQVMSSHVLLKLEKKDDFTRCDSLEKVFLFNVRNRFFLLIFDILCKVSFKSLIINKSIAYMYISHNCKMIRKLGSV